MLCLLKSVKNVENSFLLIDITYNNDCVYMRDWCTKTLSEGVRRNGQSECFLSM